MQSVSDFAGTNCITRKNVRICEICKQNSKLHWTLALGSGTFLDVAPDPSNCLVRIIAYIYVCDSYFYGIPTFEGVPHTNERTDIVMDFEDPEKLDCPSSFPFLSFLRPISLLLSFFLFLFLSTPWVPSGNDQTNHWSLPATSSRPAPDWHTVHSTQYNAQHITFNLENHRSSTSGPRWTTPRKIGH